LVRGNGWTGQGFEGDRAAAKATARFEKSACFCEGDRMEQGTGGGELGGEQGSLVVEVEREELT
jgi:hypothetical protein